ncbi:winged helix-turn-helix domain-containing protein [Enterococcus sp. 669A]|uniref:Winged helix-turn-helix domain-containing protein n=2 Tax=Candidatus Enterococcus moelleringii TaxID=2815325 RepID=A0ABS3LGQ0_9ENTE|nr:winged helix-turn-helix domain-containing protein [Enterococcus sp. 669A]
MQQHVLILTRNILSEEGLIRQLHYLNYEVLCSSDLLQVLQMGKGSPMFSYFQAVILSETLSNSEVEKILPVLHTFPIAILRNSEVYPVKEQTEWQDQGIHGWVSKNGTIETLREAIAEALQTVYEQRMASSQILAFPVGDSESERSLVKTVWNSFSKTEKKVFEQLLQAKNDGVLSRKEICDYLWREGETPSNMSQLSCLINKIKRKFERAGIKDEIVVTLWGRGYKLNEEFRERWLGEEQALLGFPPQLATN